MIQNNAEKRSVEIGTIIDPTYNAKSIALSTTRSSQVPDLGYNLLVMKTYADGKWEVVEMNKKTGKPKGQDYQGEKSLEVRKGIQVKEIQKTWLRDYNVVKVLQENQLEQIRENMKLWELMNPKSSADSKRSRTSTDIRNGRAKPGMHPHSSSSSSRLTSNLPTRSKSKSPSSKLKVHHESRQDTPLPDDVCREVVEHYLPSAKGKEKAASARKPREQTDGTGLYVKFASPEFTVSELASSMPNLHERPKEVNLKEERTVIEQSLEGSAGIARDMIPEGSEEQMAYYDSDGQESEDSDLILDMPGGFIEDAADSAATYPLPIPHIVVDSPESQLPGTSPSLTRSSQYPSAPDPESSSEELFPLPSKWTKKSPQKVENEENKQLCSQCSQ